MFLLFTITNLSFIFASFLESNITNICTLTENYQSVTTPRCIDPPISAFGPRGAVEKYPAPEFALSWQGECLIKQHAPPGPNAALDLNAPPPFPFAECAAICELRLKCVTDLIRRESLRGGGAAETAARLSPEPSERPDARCCTGAAFCWAATYTWLHIKRN